MNIMVNSVRVVVNRWFQKSGGNTYHSIKCSFYGLETNKKGCVKNIKINIHIPFAYGYDTQYKQTLLEELKRKGIDSVNHEPVAFNNDFFRYNFHFIVSDVKRKKDL